MSREHATLAPSGDSPAVGRIYPWTRVACIGVIALALAARWQFGQNHALDDDELQHLHFAWCIGQGIVPYRDFWDNHTPALHHLLATLLRPGDSPGDAIRMMRHWMFFAGLPVLAATFGLAKLLFGGRVAWMAVAWMACCEAYIDKSVEIRPDALLSACAVGGLWGWAVAIREGHCATARRALFSGGLSFGLGFVLSPKVVIALAAGGIAAVIVTFLTRTVVAAEGVDTAAPVATPTGTARDPASARNGRRPIFMSAALACAAALGAGFAVPAGVWLVHEWRLGTLSAAIRDTLLHNVGHLDRFSSLLALETAAPWGFFAAALGGSVLVVRAFIGGRKTAAAPMFVVITAWLTAAMYAIVMPSPYLQSTLLFVPAFAIFAGRLSGALLNAGSPHAAGCNEVSAAPRRNVARLGVVACVAVAAVHPLWRIDAKGEAEGPRLASALAHLDWIHGWTSDDDVVFDGRCAAVFRRHALRHPSLVRGILTGYHRGEITPTIRDQLRTSGCTVYLRDFRSRQLPAEDAAFIATHYVSMKDATGREDAYEDLRLPGRAFDAAGLANGGGLDVIAAGLYTVRRVPPDCDVLIDGHPVDAPVTLDVGLHRVTACDKASRVTIVRQPGQHEGIASDG
ncbi:MAG: hypothetical protein C4547_02460 [Phycisphaerales bacterium]|nr:MAG: hypothetical protein C4547_02460 [Phycisphaerales bacterium]